MLDIAVYYESGLGRNDGNPLYVTSYLQRVQFYCDSILKLNLNDKLAAAFPLRNGSRIDDELARKTAQSIVDRTGSGIRVTHLRPHGNLKQHGNFDVNIWIDWGEDGLKGVLPYDPIWPNHGLVVYWASDTHLGYDYRLECAKRSDIVFCAQEDAVERFSYEGINAIWLPHAFEPMAYPRYERASRPIDVCFIGHVNDDKRAEFLDRAFREFPNFYYGQKRFDQASKKYSESKLVLNQSMRGDLNMRVFEVIGSGNLLLTDRIPSIEKLFEDRKHLVLYNDLDDMVKQAKEVLASPEMRNSIMDAGYRLAMKRHTISNRVDTMLDHILSKVGSGVVI